MAGGDGGGGDDGAGLDEKDRCELKCSVREGGVCGWPGR